METVTGLRTARAAWFAAVVVASVATVALASNEDAVRWMLSGEGGLAVGFVAVGLGLGLVWWRPAVGGLVAAVGALAGVLLMLAGGVVPSPGLAAVALVAGVYAIEAARPPRPKPSRITRKPAPA